MSPLQLSSSRLPHQTCQSESSESSQYLYRLRISWVHPQSCKPIQYTCEQVVDHQRKIEFWCVMRVCTCVGVCVGVTVCVCACGCVQQWWLQDCFRHIDTFVFIFVVVLWREKLLKPDHLHALLMMVSLITAYPTINIFIIFLILTLSHGSVLHSALQ